MTCTHHWTVTSECPACLRAELNDLAAALREARAELDQWQKWGIVEIAVRNPSVMEYIKHWEGRAERAERERDALAALLLEARDVLWHQPSSVSHDPNNCVGCRTEAAIDAHLRGEGEGRTPETQPLPAEEMCPNCVTPWKCNGPHRPLRG